MARTYRQEKLEGIIRSSRPKEAFLCLYVLAIVLCVLRCTASDYPFKLFLSLCSYHCIVCPSVYGFWLPLQTFLVFMFFPLYCVSFGLRLLITPSSFYLSLCSCNCIVRSSVYGFWLPLQAFLVFMRKNIKTRKILSVIRSRKSKDTQYNGKNIKTRKAWRGNQKPYTEEHTTQLQEHKDKEKHEWIIRSRKPKDTQYNGKNIKTRKVW
jgi:hypothetical protein